MDTRFAILLVILGTFYLAASPTNACPTITNINETTRDLKRDFLGEFRPQTDTVLNMLLDLNLRTHITFDSDIRNRTIPLGIYLDFPQFKVYRQENGIKTILRQGEHPTRYEDTNLKVHFMETGPGFHRYEFIFLLNDQHWFSIEEQKEGDLSSINYIHIDNSRLHIVSQCNRDKRFCIFCW